MSEYQDHARADDRVAEPDPPKRIRSLRMDGDHEYHPNPPSTDEPDTKKIRDCTVGELLDAGYVVLITHPKKPNVFEAAFGDMTHPAEYELRFHVDGSLKGLTSHVRFSTESSISRKT